GTGRRPAPARDYVFRACLNFMFFYRASTPLSVTKKTEVSSSSHKLPADRMQTLRSRNLKLQTSNFKPTLFRKQIGNTDCCLRADTFRYDLYRAFHFFQPFPNRV